MSLLSPSVRIALTPRHVALANGRGHRSAAVAAPGWTGALEALAGLLAGSNSRGRASVTLSHHFASVHLVPPPPVALRPTEMQGWICDHLTRYFGAAGRALRVAWQPEPPGEAFVAASMEPAALETLEAMIRSASLKPVQVQPWLPVAWNRHRRRLARGRVWLALAEYDRLTLAGLEEGHMKSLRSILMRGDAGAALSDLLQREALLAGESEPAPLWVESVLPSIDWREVDGGRMVHPPASANGNEALAAMLEN